MCCLIYIVSGAHAIWSFSCQNKFNNTIHSYYRELFSTPILEHIELSLYDKGWRTSDGADSQNSIGPFCQLMLHGIPSDDLYFPILFLIHFQKNLTSSIYQTNSDYIRLRIFRKIMSCQRDIRCGVLVVGTKRDGFCDLGLRDSNLLWLMIFNTKCHEQTTPSPLLYIVCVLLVTRSTGIIKDNALRHGQVFDGVDKEWG